MHKKQSLGQSIYSGLQKGLHIGQKAVEFGAIAKGAKTESRLDNNFTVLAKPSLLWYQL